MEQPLHISIADRRSLKVSSKASASMLQQAEGLDTAKPV